MSQPQKTFRCGSVEAVLKDGLYHITELGEELGEGTYKTPGVLIAEVFHENVRQIRTFLALGEEEDLLKEEHPARLVVKENLQILKTPVDVRLSVIQSSSHGIGEVIRMLWAEQE